MVFTPPPGDLVAYGPDANCTLTTCPVTSSIYEYRPSLTTNSVFIALFSLALLLHLFLSVRSREWTFLTCMTLGCVSEVIGYGGRIMLYADPFSFGGFLMQIICITIAPVFYCAAIYVLLARTVRMLGVQHSRFDPRWFYYGFLSCDIVSLVLQSLGGAMSSQSHGQSQVANDLALAGLSFQVITLIAFIGLCIDYAVRWRRTVGPTPLETTFKVFVAFLSAAILLILVRCAYRIDELSEGYSGPLISNEGLFVGLEGV